MESLLNKQKKKYYYNKINLLCPYYECGFCVHGKNCPLQHVEMLPYEVIINFSQVYDILHDWYLDYSIKSIESTREKKVNIASIEEISPNSAYFILKSISKINIAKSQKEEVWATSVKNTLKLVKAYLEYDQVILIFSVNESGAFEGVGIMKTFPSEKIKPKIFGKHSKNIGYNFEVKWIEKANLSFDKVPDLLNPINHNLPVKISRDGQELPYEIGAKLCKMYLENNSCKSSLQNKRLEKMNNKEFKCNKVEQFQISKSNYEHIIDIPKEVTKVIPNNQK